jgi:hypothetical protein
MEVRMRKHSNLALQLIPAPFPMSKKHAEFSSVWAASVSQQEAAQSLAEVLFSLCKGKSAITQTLSKPSPR